MKKAAVFLGVSGALIAGSWYYFEHLAHDHDHEHGHDHSHSHDHGVGGHEHGVGQLSMYFDDTDVSLFFHAPAGDLVGYEHYPRDDDEREQLESVLSYLASGSWLEFPQRAECAWVSGNAETNQLDADHSGHADVTVDMSFRCERPRNLSQVSVHLFSEYSALERIDAHWIRNTRTDTVELTPENTSFRLR